VLIRPASFPADVEIVRGLFREYAAGLGFDICFQGFEAELAELPGKYAPPRGRLLLADADGGAVGCMALRPHDDEIGELKRLYVRPSARGRGAGRLLCETMIAEARAIGYRRLVLDTVSTMTAAIRLYESLGFRDVEPYNEHPIAGTRWLGLDLRVH
jgi:ribosomal protein S18 acetylase RimI-like enzyme